MFCEQLSRTGVRVPSQNYFSPFSPFVRDFRPKVRFQPREVPEDPQGHPEAAAGVAKLFPDTFLGAGCEELSPLGDEEHRKPQRISSDALLCPERGCSGQAGRQPQPPSQSSPVPNFRLQAQSRSGPQRSEPWLMRWASSVSLLSTVVNSSKLISLSLFRSLSWKSWSR